MRRKIRVNSKSGLRGQMVIWLCRLVNSYSGKAEPTKIFLEKDGVTALACEYDSVTALGVNHKDKVAVIAHGPEEEKAIKEIEKLLTTGYMS